MKFELEIEMGNDAMRLSRHLAEALREVATTLTNEPTRKAGAIRDGNGNTVGSWEKVRT